MKFIRVHGRIVPIKDKGQGKKQSAKGSSSPKLDPKADAYAEKKAKQDFNKGLEKYNSIGSKVKRSLIGGTAMAATGAYVLGMTGFGTGVTAGLAGQALKKLKPGAAGRLAGRLLFKGAAIGAVGGAIAGVVAGATDAKKNSQWSRASYKKHYNNYKKGMK